ncbi:hypothetical protein KIW84_042686 [Lathyrus oleraceus]|uniref:Uncharacterized protein n=1 Tax=Pisum sativum TaxID=3888 RepID=A0A9D5ASX1_PEA|nr:hypothetical protein KIW84_042686 [Pisum sativum]
MCYAATPSTSMEDLNLLKAFNIKVKPPRGPQIKGLWHPPSTGWTKCNCDDAYKHDDLPTGCDGIFRNQSGNFIFAFADFGYLAIFLLDRICGGH